MLTLTPEAAAAVERLVAVVDAPETAVIRITAPERRDNGGSPDRELTFAVVPEPEEGDLVVEDSRVSVDRLTSAWLDDKVLDAELIDDQVSFSLYEQPQP